MDEYIKRKTAIEALNIAHSPYPRRREISVEAIKSIPAEDVRPVGRGVWLPTKDDNKKRCSRCDVVHLIAQYPHGDINFCPNCGAEMSGGMGEARSADSPVDCRGFRDGKPVPYGGGGG